MLTYQSTGSGIPLVLIHAFPLSSEMWKEELSSFKKVKMIAPNLPGLGSPSQADISIAEMAAQIASLLDSLKINEPVIVAGLSMGGYVSFEFLRQFPKRVRGLGLFSTKATNDTSETKEKRYKTIQAIQTEGYQAFAEKTLNGLLGKTTLKSKPEVVEVVRKLILSNREDGVVAALKALASRRDSTDLLSSIQCPTMILAGDEDVVISVSEAEKMQKQIPNSKLSIFKEAGHLLNLEQPKMFADALTQFLRWF